MIMNANEVADIQAYKKLHRAVDRAIESTGTEISHDDLSSYYLGWYRLWDISEDDLVNELIHTIRTVPKNYLIQAAEDRRYAQGK
jgi:hypothetical protein